MNDIAPVFTSGATFSAAENQTSIGTVTATDSDSASITFTVSGSELAITSGGVLALYQPLTMRPNQVIPLPLRLVMGPMKQPRVSPSLSLKSLRV